MTRTRWWLALGALAALAGPTPAADGPCSGVPCMPTAYPTTCECARQETPSDCERRIEQKLRTPITLNFKDVPLRQIIEDLRQVAQVNVVADTAAIEESGMSLEQPLSLVVEDMTLKSALNILLKQARLTYIIKDGALQITTEAVARGKLKMVTYPVGDLVTPIGSGESELHPFIRRCAELQGFIHRDVRWPKATGSGCEEILIRLIRETIEPASWTDVGGSGTIQYFSLGLSLVVNQTQDVQEQIQNLLATLRRLQAKEDKEYQIEVKVYEVDRFGLQQYQSWPRITLIRGQLAYVSIGGTVLAREGSLQDLLSPVNCSPTTPVEPSAFVNAPLPDRPSPRSHVTAQPVALEVGTSLRVQVTAPTEGRLRLDATLQTSEMTEATPDGMRLVGQSYRFLKRVEPGKAVRLVLDRDSDGAAKRWLECTVTEIERKVEEEQIFLGNLPPIPR